MATLGVGARVLVWGRHPNRGEVGTVTNTPGKVFYGWTVKLDSGKIVGVGERQLKVEAGA